MKYLLDVNVLVAWGWQDHVDHARVIAWIDRERSRRGGRLATSPIPEIGFVRVSVQRSLGQVSVREAGAVLEGLLKALGRSHRFVPDDLSGTIWPAWCTTSARSTDAHLSELARRHAYRLATLDEAIPNAFLIPRMD